MATTETTAPSTASDRQVPALVRAKRILDELSRDGRPQGVSELARALDLPKSSIHGLCKTLAELGVLARIGPSQFSIGPHVLAWANAFQSQSSLTAEFQRLSAESPLLRKDALNLSVLSGDTVMYVACKGGASPLGVSFRVGMSLPTVFTATGKAMLSTFSDREVEAHVGPIWPSPSTRSSVGSLTDFRRELAQTRERGYSIDDGQLREGMFCFGAPVFDASGAKAVAGLAVGMLSVDVTEESMGRYGRDLMAFARELSRRLGAAPA